ncbi:hypothetical protein [Ferrimonas sp. YFM]|uniref:hypothetical protein n=1 Tax=Ferrimonas sp. YFM TaxID=3028878 RepID=UPI0025734802|nr:hypothetical protein [Ferrimonas sp. YFM]BDY07027.1 hypothetical protein F0521_40680 [Ferrimonas sp. YFM]
MFWKIVGTLLLLWAGWDLTQGYTYLFDRVYREADPLLYWSALAAWTTLGFSCFFSWHNH